MDRIKATAVAVAAAVIVAACSNVKAIIPPVELPRKPASSDIPCERLSDAEIAACMKEAKEARNVCRKVEKNAIICEDQQDFVRRLYDARDGK